MSKLKRSLTKKIAAGVLALTKNVKLPKNDQLQDSLNRILKEPKEVALVKIADRITNLQKPPLSWSKSKKSAYKQQAILIFELLSVQNDYLAKRLETKINEYNQYVQS